MEPDFYINGTLLDYDDVSNISLFPNNTAQGDGDKESQDFAVTVIVALLLGLIILATIIGNVFVLAAIWMERNLHSVANYLIVSLAVADLMVACLVMPLGAVYEVSQKWALGPTLCDMWTSSDVLSCSASILHLVAIAMDRYWAVTNIDYIHQRNPKRILTMIAIIWSLSSLISLAQLGWKDEKWQLRIDNEQCMVNQDLGYQIFGTLSSFYVPLAVILFLYYRIFQAARKRIRKRRAPPSSATALLPRPTAETSLITAVSSSNPSPEKSVLMNNGGNASASANTSANATTSQTAIASMPLAGSYSATHQLLPASPNLSSSATTQAGMTPDATPAKKTRSPRELETKRERKAAKTLAIVTGAFIICWLPFFVVALAMPLCHPGCQISPRVLSVFLWLGYINSMLNPVIYTIFNPAFRRVFMKIFGKQGVKTRGVAV